MIDLHVHSTASDGTLAPEAVVDLAAEKNVSVIALTDHDTVTGVLPALERGRYRKVEVIPGVELGVQWNGPGQMHILGYYIDDHQPRLLECLSWLREHRQTRGRRMVDRLDDLGVPVSWERVCQLAGGGSVGRPHVAQALLEAGYVKSISEAFERFVGSGAPAYVDRVQLTSAEVIELIRGSGGVAVLAHPATLRLEREALKACLELLIGEGLQGMEVYWSKHQEAEITAFEELARCYRLIKTAGSDFHGSNKPSIELGARLAGRISENAVLESLRSARNCT